MSLELVGSECLYLRCPIWYVWAICDHWILACNVASATDKLKLIYFNSFECKKLRQCKIFFSSVQSLTDSLQPHESQHTRPPCPSPTPGVHSDSRPSSQWCHPASSSSVVPFSSCPQSLPASESFPMSQLFAWGGQSTGFSASVVSNSVWPHKWQPTRLLCPWDSPGKNTEVCCHFLLQLWHSNLIPKKKDWEIHFIILDIP